MADRSPQRRSRHRVTRPAAAGLLLIGLLLAACLPQGNRGADGSTDGGPIASSGIPIETPVPAPSGPTPIPSFVRPTPTPMPTFLVYTVAQGDNLNTIAHRFGTTARSIAFWNRATYSSLDPESSKYRPGLLKVGWTLSLIPNVTFDEQTLPEPSDLAGGTPSATP